MENDKSKREDVCPSKKLNRADVERQLTETKGPEYWRSLEELAGSPEFQEMLHREFAKGASEWVDSVSRRGFLQLMGASLDPADVRSRPLPVHYSPRRCALLGGVREGDQRRSRPAEDIRWRGYSH